MTASISAPPGRGMALAALMPWAIGLVTGIDYFDNALFAFFASYIAGGISATADELVWASSVYALGAVLGILQQHAWVERLGYRRYLALCMFAFAAAGVCAALCENPVQLALARGVQGYFVGPMLGACRILIQIGIAPQRRPKALRAFMVLIVFGGGLAPVVGAFLVTHFEWRALFLCTVPAAVLAGALVLWTLPDIGDVAPHERTEPHRLAYLVFALAQAALQVVLTRTHFELFSTSPALIGLAIAGIAGLAWFAQQQWRQPAPLVRLHAFRHSTFRVGLALYVVYYYLSTGFSYLLPRLMEGGLGFTVGDTGYFTGMASLAASLLVFVYLRHSARVVHKKWLIVPGFGIAALAAWWLAQMSPEVGRAALLGPLLLRGLMMLFVVLPVANLTFRPFAAEEFAHGYRLKNLVRQLAISFATATAIAVQTHRVALHEARLSESTTASNATFVQALDLLTRGFVASGHAIGEAHAMALGSLWRVLEQQATFMASLDGFEVMAVIALAAGAFAAWQREID
ncbi:Multidrug resistance protein B [Variovorax sp. SRS16]|uniref:MFS transporter n=1 Tax=Variovorax sp. SRS16 TaxID=282217 RepID=UPI0013182C0E|nr:MFS transporter [Variovorax sp. SRS16]VTU13787.1 Multidrug resistance protein B [Variovorax sp. SRS16]